MADNNLTTKEEFLLNPVEEHNITDAVVASFETNLKHPLKVTVPITPQQDLHGMPNPYPAGASVNLIPDGTDTSNGYVASKYLDVNGNAVDSSYCYISEYFEIDPATTYTWSNRVNTSSAGSIGFYDENKDFISGIAINGQYSHTFIPPEGSVYCRSTQTTYAYQKSNPTGGAVYQLEVGSTATEYRRYSNICPIDGTIETTINATKENLLPRYCYNNLSYAKSVGNQFTSIKKNGRSWAQVGDHLEYTPSSNYTALSVMTNLLQPGLYHFDLDRFSTSQLRFTVYTLNSEYVVKSAATSTNVSHDHRTLSLTEPGYVAVMLDNGSTSNQTIQIQISVTKGNVARDYSPYVGTTLPITFTDPSTGDPMTIYGGSLTLNEDGSVDLSKTHAKIIIDGTKYTINNINTTDTRTSFRVSASDIPFDELWKNRGQSLRTGAISNWATESYQQHGHNSDSTNFKPNSFALSGTYRSYRQIGISIDPVENATIEYIKEYLGQNPLEICYILDTPKTYHFPNVGQLKAFLGTNNVWSDIGNVNVKYLTQHSETGLEYRGDRALELRRRAMMADAPTIHTTVGSEETGGLASFKSYVKAPVKKIEIPFYPKQDLHGYDNPWPAGGGKNLVPLPEGFYTTGYYQIGVNSPELLDALQNNLIPGHSYRYWCEFIYENTGAVVQSKNNDGIQIVVDGTNYIMRRDTTLVMPEGTISKINVVSGDSDKSGKRIFTKLFVCEVTDNHTLTEADYVPYANICPISGWDGANITGVGKNLWNKDADFGMVDCYNYQGTAFSRRGIIYHLPAGTYTLSATRKPDAPSAYINANIINTDNSLGEYSSIVNSVTIYNRSITIGNGQHLVIYDQQAQTASAEVKFGYFDIQLEIGSTITAFEAYKPQTLPLTFNQSGDHSFAPIQEGTGTPSPENVRPIHPRLTFTRDDDSVLTIWGGNLIVNADGSGNIVENKVTGTIEDLNFIYQSSYDRFYTSVLQSTVLVPSTGVTNYICESLKPAPNGVEMTGPRINFASSGNLFIFGTDYKTVEELNDAIGSTKICYTLSSPTTYTLSVTETNRALEALGLTQHIGPLYGGTITINPDGSADAVSDRIVLTKDHLLPLVRNYKQGIEVAKITPWNENTTGAARLCALRFNIYNTFFMVRTDSVVANCLKTYHQGNWQVDSTRNAWGIETYVNGQTMITAPYGELPTIDDWIDWLDSSDLFVVGRAISGYEQTYHFSNLEQLKVWLGENNFWCDISDDITVKYWNRG